MNELKGKKMCENNHWQCSNCGCRFPTDEKTCFVCGSNNIILNEIKEKIKKSGIKGATLQINMGEK